MAIESGATLEEIIKRTCELSAETLQVSRVGVWMFNESRTILKCVQLFEATTGCWSEGAVLHVADFPDYFATLCSRKIVPAESALTDPKTSELVDAYLAPLGITSMLDAPIFIRGEVIGVLCNEQIGQPREWTTEDRDFSASIADLLALKLRAAEVVELKETLRATEDRLMTMEKSEAVARMALGIAHDFRNLLTSITNAAHVLSKAEELTPANRESVLLIQGTASRGARLVSELIDFGRTEPGKPKALDLRALIIKFLPVLQTAAGSDVRLVFDDSRSSSRVFMDANQLERILLNLVLNARESMPNGGNIELRAYDDTKLGVVTLEVHDHGCGMDPATQAKMFEPFYTNKPDGSGLGLAIVQRIVDRAGGFIRVDSMIGHGTTLKIHLPRVGTQTHS